MITALPIEARELIIEGTPRSLQGSPAALKLWRRHIIESARRAFDEDCQSIQYREVFACFLHFCPSSLEGQVDLDNIVKPILDALVDSHRVLFDDSRVAQLFVHRVAWEQPPRSTILIPPPSATLTARLQRALDGTDPREFIYALVTTDFSLEVRP